MSEYLCIGVCIYSDTGVGHGGHPRIVWVSSMNMDTQTQGLVIGGHARIVWDSVWLVILGVHGYSDPGVGHHDILG